MDERDAAAKAKARRSKNSSRVKRVPAEEAARIDARIAEKSRNAGAAPREQNTEMDTGVTSNRDKKSSSPKRSSTTKKKRKVSKRASAANQLNQMEADVLAKSQASSRSGAGATAVPRSRLNQLEGEVHAKYAGASVGTQNQLHNLEAQVQAKTRSSSGRSSSDARTQLNQLEADVQSKTRAAADSRSSHSRNARSQLNQMEADLQSKTRNASSTSQQGARAQLQNLEAQVQAKSSGRPSSPGLQPRQVALAGASSALNQLENEVTTKLRPDATPMSSGSHHAPTNHYHEPQPEDDSQTEIFFDEMKKDTVDLGNGATFQTSFPSFDDPAATKTLEEEKPAHAGPETAPPAVTANHGILNEPNVQYGTHVNGGQGMGELAVAIAIQAEEEDAFIPAAVQYDPDNKPPLYKNRRFRIWTLVMILLLGVIAAATILVVTKNSAGPSADNPKLTLRERTYDFKAPLAAKIGEAVFDNPNSVYSQALQWIVNEDTMNLVPNDRNYVQRFILAAFHLGLTQYKPWQTCNRPEEGMTSSCTFYKYTQLFPQPARTPISWTRWMSDEHECQWAGIFCDEFNQTRAIELVGQEIRGELPSSIIHLPYLQSLTMTANELIGTLPSELGSMKHLLNVELHMNYFTGTIPTEWYGAQSLQRLNLGENRLTGTVATEIGLLTTMKGIFLFENKLTGTIPTEIGNMKFLSFTRWYDNLFTGTLPTEIGRLEKLRELWVFTTPMKSPIPTEVGNMRDLTDFRFMKQEVTGTIPSELFNAPQLSRFDGYDTLLSGTIPTEIGLGTKLEKFRIRGSDISGTIPTEIGLAPLKQVWFHRTKLTGTIPNEICALRGESATKLNDFSADCAGQNPWVLDPEQCAGTCCNHDDFTCKHPAY